MNANEIALCVAVFALILAWLELRDLREERDWARERAWYWHGRFYGEPE